jgi:hypothetical protein
LIIKQKRSAQSSCDGLCFRIEGVSRWLKKRNFSFLFW